MMDLLHGVTSAGTSLVMVTHNLGIAASAELFARVHGQIAGNGV
ncbi:Hypothetical protein CpMEX30_1611 [Corynebacterium pseudotuberculosis]|nr:hypothetical protein [Corynebacterium pseudotuberculosis]AKS13885.1 Hypothetical protein CpE19_1547 [Corynebacterium pseudotuberculosis]APQ54633.1 Hypothetical protein CpMEX30_1611 [Corynebacterium pseudotuberculosis]APQ56708.1 Hypothetical protein CpMEX31_1599 [Corynebacterium pseudotuberculosis]ATB62504.1 Hypothetical protein BFF96_1630 [Corynebacterium pseudotuberculosis]ATV79513.1 Hypothetical protein BFF97_00759 [Corynebacterium pseudotuberculosis]